MRSKSRLVQSMVLAKIGKFVKRSFWTVLEASEVYNITRIEILVQ